MAESNSGEVRFCDDCPARGNFLDEPGEATSMIIVKMPRGIDKGDRSSEDYEVIVAALDFTDMTQGYSDEVTASIIYNSRRKGRMTTAHVDEAARNTIVDIAERIGVCASHAINKDGQRYCPAFNSEVFSALVRNELALTVPE